MYEVIEPQLALSVVNPYDPLLATAGFATSLSSADTLSAIPAQTSDAELLLQP